jgi:hypothetical protein
MVFVFNCGGSWNDKLVWAPCRSFIPQLLMVHKPRGVQFSSRTWSAPLPLSGWSCLNCPVCLCAASPWSRSLLRTEARLSFLIRRHGMMYIFLFIPLLLCLWFSCSCCSSRWAWNQIHNVAKWWSTKFPNNFYTCSGDLVNKSTAFASRATFLRSCLLRKDSEFVGLGQTMGISEIYQSILLVVASLSSNHHHHRYMHTCSC